MKPSFLPQISHNGAMKDDPGESSVISALTDSAALPAWVLHGPGDDAAILENGQVLTTDLMVEDVHFDSRISPEDLAWKLLAVNASDVAACGARSSWALLSIALPEPLDNDWVNRFSQAFKSHLATLKIALIGGDTTRSPKRKMLNLCLCGQLESAPLLRSSASPNEDVWVSGTLGDASAGFSGMSPELTRRWHRPEPPLELGPALASRELASAAMDLSDGLLQDLEKLCKASRIGAKINPLLLPSSPALKATGDALLGHQVAFGEDYQLLFTASPQHREAIAILGSDLGLLLTRIGTTLVDETIELPGSETLEGWSHFGGPQ